MVGDAWMLIASMNSDSILPNEHHRVRETVLWVVRFGVTVQTLIRRG